MSGHSRDFTPLYEAMFRHRHRVFAEALGWRALHNDEGREVDMFDTADAHYLVAVDSEGALRGSVRLIPTLRPHLMAALFADYVDGDPPRAASIWEWSRHCPGAPEWPPQVNAAARAALHVAACEFALARGIRAFTALMDVSLLRRARALGWACHPLGPPRAYAEGVAQAVLNPVTQDVLQRIRLKTGFADRALMRQAA